MEGIQLYMRGEGAYNNVGCDLGMTRILHRAMGRLIVSRSLKLGLITKIVPMTAMNTAIPAPPTPLLDDLLLTS